MFEELGTSEHGWTVVGELGELEKQQQVKLAEFNRNFRYLESYLRQKFKMVQEKIIGMDFEVTLEENRQEYEALLKQLVLDGTVHDSLIQELLSVLEKYNATFEDEVDDNYVHVEVSFFF